MDGASLPNDIHGEFLSYLQSDGIRRTNFEEKSFYSPRQLSQWLLHKESNTTSSRAAQLFSAVYDNRESSTGKFFPTLKDKDVERDPMLFAILVHMECGHMLHIFRNSIRDNYLGFHNLSHLYTDIEQALEEDKVTLPSQYKDSGYTGVTSDFERQRWAFNPALNVLEMAEVGIEGKSILPFFHREIINEGGTAKVHHHKVHVDLVESDNLRQILEPRKRDDKTGIEYYEFAVKTYLQGFDDIYRMESEAFKGFNGTKDPRSLGVVTYLGEYTLHDRGGDGVSAQGVTRHIMLEFGEQDLDEYLADTYPPVLNEEIIAFWESLFQIAETLSRIHQLEHIRGDKVQKYVGWHGDIKPDNILRVRGNFKLADFGFTRFEKNVIGEPQTTHMLGGTRAYGAPERDRSDGKAKVLHSTTIDTWSLGCVFSAVATWVVLGSQGYENYGEMRAMAHQRLRQRHNHDSSVNVSNCSDAFHDGFQVLPAVLDWHEYLRSSSRKADTITCRVLDLIEDGMLNQDPEKRLKSASLCQGLDKVLVDASIEYQEQLHAGVLRRQSPEMLSALLELDKRAPKSAEPQFLFAIEKNYRSRKEGTDSEHANGSRLGIARSSRVKKSERVDKILRGKIANREEVIRSGYDSGTIHELSGDDETAWHGVEKRERRSLLPNPTPINLPEAHRLATLSNAVPINKRLESPIPTIIHPYSEHEGGSNSGLPGSDSRPYRTTTELNHIPPVNGTQINALYEEESSPIPLPLRPRSSRAEGNAQEVQGSFTLGTVELDASSPGVQPIPLTESASGTFSGNPDIVSPITPTSSPRDPLDPNGHTPSPATRRNTFQSRQQIPIVQEYDRLLELWDRAKGSWYTLQGDVPQEIFLANFIENRDVVFVVDNAASMSFHWNDVTTTLLALAMKIGTLDKDGLDLMFTIGERHNVFGATEWSIPEKFRKSLQGAEKSMHHRSKTNMATTLLKIFDKYENHSKKQTLIILTDGLWEGSNTTNDVEATISDFIKGLKTSLKKSQLRWFTIQFVSFGSDDRALQRLQLLDDELGKSAGEDVIDWKPWDSNDADSLIVGSIDPQLDSQDPSCSSPDPAPRAPSFPHGPTTTLHSKSKSKRKRFGKILGL